MNPPEQDNDITDLDLQALLLAEEQNKLDMMFTISQTVKTHTTQCCLDLNSPPY